MDHRLAVGLLLMVAVSMTVGHSHQHLNKDECITNENMLNPSKMYRYKYKANGDALMVGTTDQKSRMELDCEAKIWGKGNCLYGLKVKDCKVTGKGGSESNTKAWMENKDLGFVSEHVVLFTLSNGDITGVYAEEGESIQALNIKRAILSAFVASKTDMSNGVEDEEHTDIHGTCPITVKKEGGKIKTSKNMIECDYPSRPDWHFSPWSLAWDLAPFQLLLNSTVDCDYDVAGQTIKSVHCRERHALKFESSDHTKNGVQTVIDYHMTLLEEKATEADNYVQRGRRETGIEFEHPPTSTPSVNPPDFTKDAEEALYKLVSTSREDVKPETPAYFGDLIHVLRTGADLSELVDSAVSCKFLKGADCDKRNKELTTGFLNDGLIQCNTVPCMKAFAQMVKKDEVRPTLLWVVLLSWNNMQIPKEEYIDEIFEICKHTQSSLCWMTLGTVIHKCHHEHPHEGHQVPKGIRDSVAYMSNYLKEDCSVEESEFPAEFKPLQPYDYLLTIVKAIGNVGEVGEKVNPKLTEQLYHCVINKKLPRVVQVSAIEAMRNMNSGSYMRTQLLWVLTNTKSSVDHRIAAYRVLIEHFNDEEFIKEIMKILKSEKDSLQMKTYISSHLRNILTEHMASTLPTHEDDDMHEKLVQNIRSGIESYRISLEEFPDDRTRFSENVVRERFVDYKFLPKKLRGFGGRLDTSVIFNTLNTLPSSISANFTAEMFNKVVNLFEVGVHTGGWEEVIGWAARLIHGEESWSPEHTTKIMSFLGIPGMLPPQAKDHSHDQPIFNEAMEKNIHKLHAAYKDAHPNLKPIFLTYSRIFGNDIHYTPVKDMIVHLFTKALTFYAPAGGPKQDADAKKEFSWTHAVKFMEGGLYIPTLMGAPLNWTSCATVAFTLDAKVGSSSSGKGYAVDLHVSHTVGMVNKMVLDLPTVTRVGAMTNTTVYTSVPRDFEISINPSKRSFSLKLGAHPEKDYTYLSMKRDMAIIKCDDVEVLPDWDIERTTNEYCSGKLLEDAYGVKICHRHSYPNVRDRKDKPWFTMAGSTSWDLTGEIVDKGIKSYNLHLDRSPSETVLKAFVEGGSKKRETVITLNLIGNGEYDFHVATTKLPDFDFKATKRQVIEGGDQVGVKRTANLKFAKDKNVQMTYDRKYNKDTRTDLEKAQNKPREITHDEHHIKVKSPYNTYQWDIEYNNQNKRTTFDFDAAYENLDDDWNWPAMLYPEEFFETKKKGTMKIHTDWQQLEDVGPEGFHRHTINYILLPKTKLQLETERKKTPERQQLELNLTKTDLEEGKLMSFVNLTRNAWYSTVDGTDKSHKVWNLTIPRNSWGIVIDRENSKAHYKLNLDLIAARMEEKEEGRTEAVWWHPESAKHFNHVENKIELDVDVTKRKADPAKIPAEVTELHTKTTNEGSVDELLGFDIDAELKYPRMGGQESVSLKGDFNYNRYNSRYYWLTKNTVLESTYRQLKYESVSSVLYNRINKKKLDLDHKATLHNQQSGNKGFHNLNVHIDSKDCPWVKVSHDLTSNLLNFNRKILWDCDAEHTKGSHFYFNSTTSSQHYELLNTDMKQYFHFGPVGEETLSFRHPTLEVDVKADWNMPQNYLHKTWDFRSKTDLIPSMKWEVNMKSPTVVKGEIRGQENNIDITRKSLGPYKAQYEVEHENKAAKNKRKVLDLTVSYHPTDVVSVGGAFDSDRLCDGGKWVAAKMKTACERLWNLAHNEDHPVNKALESYLRAPSIAKYVERVNNERAERREYLKNRASDIIRALKPFYLTVHKVLLKHAEFAKEKMQKFYDKYQHRLITVWAWNYFEIPKYIEKAKNADKEEIKALLEKYRPSNLIKIRELFRSKYFYLSPEAFMVGLPHPYRVRFFLRHLIAFPWHLRSWKMAEKSAEMGLFEKTAVIMWKGHVVTFDNNVYKLPDFPQPACAYLLAHDLQDDKFSAIISGEAVTLIFPEMSVTLKVGGNIFINGSSEATSVPTESANGLVTVSRAAEVVVVYGHGLTAHCDAESVVCTFRLSRWHQKGTIGLLGNADTEPANDFMLPDGRIVGVTEFANNYELSGNGACRALSAPKTAGNNAEVTEQCTKEMYEVGKCFKTLGINFNDLVDACVINVNSNMDKCHVINGAAALCNQYGYHVPTCGKTCTGTNAEDQKSPLSLPWYVKGNQDLEVVVVLDHKVAGKASNGIQSTLNAIDKAFSGIGYNVKYTFVGYGGTGFHTKPHMMLTDNNIWVPLAGTTKVLSNLHDHTTTHSYLAQLAGASGVTALEYASKMVPFTNPSSKIALVFTGDDEKSYTRFMVWLTEKYLQFSGITAYTFGNYPDVQKGKKVFGIQADGKVIPSGEKTHDWPKGNLAHVTEETEGAVFFSNFVTTNDPVTFFTEAANTIVAKVRKEGKQCRRCTCSYGPTWRMRTHCAVVSC